MKYWLSQLPLEVWVDVFCYPWIKREELGRIVDRFCNRNYADYLQFYLHDWGKRKLNKLHIDEDVLYKFVRCKKHYLEFPQTPLPSNIRSFECISIEHFDAQTLAFLRQVQPILTYVGLEIATAIPFDGLENMRILLANLVPLLNAIHSLACDVRVLSIVEQSVGNEKLSQIRLLEFTDKGIRGMDEAVVQASVNCLLKWLTSTGQANNNNGPKWCEAFLSNGDVLFGRISSAIREEFNAAKTPHTFAFVVHLNHSAWQQFVEFHEVNTTGGELHGVQTGHGHVQITRHRANCGAELQAWIDCEKHDEQKHNQIRIFNPTLGLLDAIMDAPDENEDKDQQTSSSKEA